jgi:PDZ domain
MTRYNLSMRVIVVVAVAAALPILVLCTAACAQTTPQLASQPGPKSVTVPLKLSHDRIIVDVDLRLSDGTSQRVRAWVDNGNPDLFMSRRLAVGAFSCDGQLCSATAPSEMSIGGMAIPLGGKTPGTGIKEARVPAVDKAPIAAGLDAEINIPSTVLRNYDVLINFPDHQFTIGQPGSLQFKGVNAKVIVNPKNGLIQVPSQIDRKKYNLGLDLGQSISFLSGELFDKLSATHLDWPRLTGAIGPANVLGSADEPTWKLMRVDRVQFGPLFLTNVAVAEFPKDQVAQVENRVGGPTAGLLSSEALLNYRVGLDYAHSMVYFDIGRLFDSPDFDVIGLILRPEDDGGFTVLGIADYDGKPSVAAGDAGVQVGDHLIAVDGIPVHGSTLGQVWSMLAGSPGTERTLTIERGGRQFGVPAQVQHFLGDAPEENQKKRSKSKN